MRATRVSVRELKSRLSHYLRLMKAGGPVEITERGVPIGRIVPVTAREGDHLMSLVETGLAQWDRLTLPPMKPVARAAGRRTVAELLVEDRE
ncbi:MAG: type II toxin-antitoxin system prevent-host-death family antitoxin [Gemmatimonadales bacterium]|nr:type II toxin-antitoxin system prevent-host-death family antitoxin [Gemmatimonadales bacterium]